MARVKHVPARTQWDGLPELQYPLIVLLLQQTRQQVAVHLMGVLSHAERLAWHWHVYEPHLSVQQWPAALGVSSEAVSAR